MENSLYSRKVSKVRRGIIKEEKRKYIQRLSIYTLGIIPVCIALMWGSMFLIAPFFGADVEMIVKGSFRFLIVPNLVICYVIFPMELHSKFKKSVSHKLKTVSQ